MLLRGHSVFEPARVGVLEILDSVFRVRLAEMSVCPEGMVVGKAPFPFLAEGGACHMPRGSKFEYIALFWRSCEVSSYIRNQLSCPALLEMFRVSCVVRIK